MSESHVSLITLGVVDITRSAAFYEALGWRRAPVDSDEVAFLRGGTVVISLYGREALAADSAVAHASSSYAVNVESEAAVDGVMDRATAAGATVTRRAHGTDWGGYIGYFTDPDGHLWEVAHNPSFPLDDDGRIYLPGFEEEAAAEAAANDAQIDDFIRNADTEDGALVRRLADAVSGDVTRAADGIAATLADQPNNVVVATMLELGRRSRELPPEGRAVWIASAASTLVSPLIRPD